MNANQLIIGHLNINCLQHEFEMLQAQEKAKLKLTSF